jgi:hypothetical protein
MDDETTFRLLLRPISGQSPDRWATTRKCGRRSGMTIFQHRRRGARVGLIYREDRGERLVILPSAETSQQYGLAAGPH